MIISGNISYPSQDRLLFTRPWKTVCAYFLSVTFLARRDDVSSANTFGTMGYYGGVKQLLPQLRKPQGSLLLLEHRRGATWNFA